MTWVYAVICDECGAVVTSPASHADAARRALAQQWNVDRFDSSAPTQCDECGECYDVPFGTVEAEHDSPHP